MELGDAVCRLRYEATHLGVALLLGGAQLVRVCMYVLPLSTLLLGSNSGVRLVGAWSKAVRPVVMRDVKPCTHRS